MKAEAQTPKSAGLSNPQSESTPSQPHRSIANAVGLASSFFVLAATAWVMGQYLKHRPVDLLGSTRDVGSIATDTLRNQGLSHESIQTEEPRLEQTPRAHFYRTQVDAQLPDTLNPERVMNALERALWRDQIVLATQDAGETERSAILRVAGVDIGEIRLHHAPARHKATHPAPAELPPHDPSPDTAGKPAPATPPPTPALDATAPHTAAPPPAPKAQDTPPSGLSPGQWVPAFGPALPAGGAPLARTRARVAIIVDDGGYGGEATDLILSLDPALTLAILPNTPHGTALAELAKQRGFEIILHMPMENTSPTLVHPGQIDGGMDADEIRRLTLDALAQVPGAAGINNHEGSKFTANAKALGRFMAGIENSGLYFIDSRTTSESVAFEVARQFGIPTATRNVFLDHDNDPAKIREQFARLLNTARTQGTAIGIGHFRKDTAEILRESLPLVSAGGLELVHASELVR